MHDVSLSVVIPTYRRPALLHRLLTALEPQVVGKPDRRVIVVNDGSHDDAYAKVAERFQSIIDYVALPQNSGPAAARNAGVGKANGNYLVFTDDDCVPPPHWLDWLAAIVQEYPYAAVIAGPGRPLPSKSPTFMEQFAEINNLGPKPRFTNGQLYCLPTANVAIRRDWFEKAGGFDDRFLVGGGEDTNLTHRLKKAGASFHLDLSWFTHHDQNWRFLENCERWFRHGYGGGMHFGLTGDVNLLGRVPVSYTSGFWAALRKIGRVRKQYRRSGQSVFQSLIYTALHLLRPFLFRRGYRRGYKLATKLGGRNDSPDARALEAGHSPARPNLFIIGAMKSGTSSLHYNLKAHPSIFMSRPKEIHYFVEETGFDIPQFRELLKNEDDYLRLFAAAGDAKVIGDSSTTYAKLARHPGVARRLADFNPDARIIYIMRDPVRQTISHYWHAARNLGETQDILKAVQENPHYRDVGHYAMQLAPYFELFDSSQIKTLTMEELEADPVAVLRGLYEWLGVDASFVPLSVYRRWHVTPTIFGQVRRFPGLRWVAESHFWRTIGRKVPSPLLSAGRWLSERKVDRTSVPVNQVVDYLRPIQRVQTQELSRMLGRDFPEWTTLYGSTGSPGPMHPGQNAAAAHNLLRPPTMTMPTVVIKERSRLGNLLCRRNLWGYYVESELAMRTIIRRELPAPRFVVYAQSRSGGVLLCELLGSHSQIHCDLETLAYSVRDVHRYLRRSALAATRPAYGFKVKLDHLANRQKIDDVGGFLRRMHEDGWHIVYLMRRNLFRGAYSSLAYRVRGKAHLYSRPDGSAPPMPRFDVKIENIMSHMHQRQKLLKLEQETLKGLPYKTLVYEDDLYHPSDQQRAVGELVEWLGLMPEPLHTNLLPTTPRNLREVITNFDELKAWLQGTEFEADFREATGS